MHAYYTIGTETNKKGWERKRKKKKKERESTICQSRAIIVKNLQ